MRPTFGRLTRALAVILVVTGLGATFVGMNSGSQTTPGSAHDGLILLGIGAAHLIVGAGLWMEYLWAWWAGVALTSFVVLMDLALGSVTAVWSSGQHSSRPSRPRQCKAGGTR
jgi:hypothetical protein